MSSCYELHQVGKTATIFHTELPLNNGMQQADREMLSMASPADPRGETTSVFCANFERCNILREVPVR